MKRLFVSLLAVAMVCLVRIPGLAATEESYTMRVLVNGAQSCQVEQGSTVTVSLTMTKNGASNFNLYCMQDYVCFDPAYFQYVEDSLEVYTVGGEWKTPLFQASAVSVPAGQSQDNRIFVNRASDNAQALASGVTVMSFQLKALRVGSTELTHAVMEVFRDPYQPHSVSGKSAAVTVVKAGSGGTTPTPEPEESANPQPSVPPSQKPGGDHSSSTGSSLSSSSSQNNQQQNDEGGVLQDDNEPSVQDSVAPEQTDQLEQNGTDGEEQSPTLSQDVDEQGSEADQGSHTVLTVVVVLAVLAVLAGVGYFGRKYYLRKK